MKTMRYVDHGAGGPPEVLRLAECAVPAPGAGEVLIEVAFAGVNRPDCAQRIGRYPPPPGASPILGLEVSGRVVRVGPGVDRWREGDLVCALTPGGGYAEYCLAPATHCLPVPPGMALEQAASLPETCFTVWDNVFSRAGLKPGERFLVHGGSSGIGVTAIQMAKAFGARVMTTVGTPEKAAFCRALGADLAVNYRDDDFVREAMAFTGDRGLDVVLDMVGGSYLARNLEALALDGRIALIAFMGGADATLPIPALLRKRATLTGSTLRPRTVAQKGAIARDLERHWWPRLAAGQGTPVIDRVFPWAEAAQAHARMESSVHAGKIILAVA
ncbi:NAD(P)H-quinone oxidoreductase [Pigmentiphaga sp. NML080357]|nr:NAD(P)H-quinone oxidoreductase [Pigmentiphaga sp. NML080357]